MGLLDYLQYLILIGFCLVSVLGFLIILYRKSRSYQHWSNHAVYQTRRRLIYFLGHFAEVLVGHKSLSSLCYELYAEHPASLRLVGFYFLEQPALLVREYCLVRDVLGVRSSCFSSAFLRPSSKLDPLVASSPPFAIEDDWTTRVFDNRPRLQVTFDKLLVMGQELECFMDTLPASRDGSYDVVVDLDVLVNRYARNIGMNIGLGMDVEQSGLVTTLAIELDNCIADVLKPSLNQSLCLMAPGIAAVLGKRLVSTEHHDLLSKLASRVLTGRYPIAHKESLIHWLANAKPEEQVRQLFGFLVETRVYLLGLAKFAICELAVNKDAQQKARWELKDAFARNHRALSMSLIQDELPYLDQVITETLRLYPPVGCIARVCTQRTRLEYDGEGCWVRPGDLVFVSVRGMHSDHKWWTDPRKFDPDRFHEDCHDRRLFAPNEGLSPTNAQFCHLALKMFIVTMIRMGHLVEVVGENVPQVDPRSYITVPLGNVSVVIARKEPRKRR